MCKTISNITPAYGTCGLMYARIFKKPNEQLSEVFYTMEKTYKKTDFDKLMKRFKQFDVRVKNYLELVEYEKWAMLYGPIPLVS